MKNASPVSFAALLVAAFALFVALSGPTVASNDGGAKHLVVDSLTIRSQQGSIVLDADNGPRIAMRSGKGTGVSIHANETVAGVWVDDQKSTVALCAQKGMTFVGIYEDRSKANDGCTIAMGVSNGGFIQLADESRKLRWLDGKEWAIGK